MADWQGWTPSSGLDEQVFEGASTGSPSAVQEWVKPRGAVAVCFWVLGSGGGGGLGFGAAAGTDRCGGGGGGGSALTVVTFAAADLPGVLYVRVPPWTAGSADGALSLVLTYITGGAGATADTLIQSGNVAPTAGAAGSATAGGFNGTAGSGFFEGNAPGVSPGIWVGTAGATGSQGGTIGAAGQAQTLFAVAIPVTGGAGGGSTNAANATFAGGDQIGAGPIPTIPGGAAAGGAGRHGMVTPGPWCSQGGTGGGSVGASGTGGAGGNGAYGAGGGGGGAGVTGGAGGRGGPGLVRVVSW